MNFRYFGDSSPTQSSAFIMMTSSNGNIFRVTGPLCGEFTGPGEFPTQRPVTRSFDVFFDLRLNKRLSKQPWGWWFETLSWSLWRHGNVLKSWHVHAYRTTVRELWGRSSADFLQNYPHKELIMWSFDVFLPANLNKLLNKKLSSWLFEMASRPCDVTVIFSDNMTPNSLEHVVAVP